MTLESHDPMIEALLIILAAGILPGLYFGVGIVARLQADRRAASLMGTGRLALTYDDGPSPEQTDRILKLLEDRKAHATFFVIGHSATTYPEVIGRIVAAGHEVGWHSLAHLNQWRASPSAAWRDTSSIPAILENLDPVASIYRPPYGKLNLLSVLAARRRRLRISTWTRPSGDTDPTIPDVQEIVDQVDADGGGVVLMHDNKRTNPDGDARDHFVAQLTAALLDLAQRRGWTLVPVPESSRTAT